MRKIKLSKSASNKLEKLLYRLENEWSSRSKQNFIKKLDISLEQIKNHPLSTEKSEIRKGLNRCVVTKQTTLFYKFDTKTILIVTIFDNRMDPMKFKEVTKIKNRN